MRADLVVGLRGVAERTIVGNEVRSGQRVISIVLRRVGVSAMARKAAASQEIVEREKAEYEHGEDRDRDDELAACEHAGSEREHDEQCGCTGIDNQLLR